MTKDEAQVAAEKMLESGPRFAFVFEVPKGFVIGTADRGGGWCSNFREAGFGDSWESALQDAADRIKSEIVVVNQNGVYLFTGDEPKKISQEIKQ